MKKLRSKIYLIIIMAFLYLPMIYLIAYSFNDGKTSVWKGFTLTAAVNYNQYVGFTDKYNEDYLICNVYLGKKLFKNQQGEVLIGVNDLLNENTAFARSVGSGYTQNMWNSTVGRYFTIQFNYNLRFFGKKGSKDISKYDGMGGVSKMSGGMPPFAGGRPPMMHPH